jgi:Holliday junction resolvase RusA-like endonuclease
MLTRSHAFMVIGVPVQQGDMVCYGRGRTADGKTIHKLSHKNADDLDPWRSKVAAAAGKWIRYSPDGGEVADKHQPLDVVITWSLERPAGHWGTGRNADTLKASSPAYPTTGLDVDKLTRAILDALQQSSVLDNDAQVIDVIARKRYARMRGQVAVPIGVPPLVDDVLPCPGVVVRLYPKEDPPDDAQQ